MCQQDWNSKRRHSIVFIQLFLNRGFSRRKRIAWIRVWFIKCHSINNTNSIKSIPSPFLVASVECEYSVDLPLICDIEGYYV